MSTAVLPNIGDRTFLENVLQVTTPPTQQLRLFTAVSPAIDANTIASHFTEATASGYATATLSRASWVVSATGTATYPQVTFTLTAAETVLGYYLTEFGSGTLLWCEQLDAPIVVPGGGGTINVDLSITLD